MTMQLPDTLRRVLAAMPQGWTAAVVGGAVRDHILGLQPKDFDVEVFGATYDALRGFLAGFGRVDVVGQSFGIVKLWAGGTDFDFSLPRRDSKNGVGHTGFTVETDGGMTLAEAAARRDFTINAMSWVDGKLFDPFGGVDSLNSRVLRHVGPAFAEDPLRVLRGFQFAARFGMTGDPDTLRLCRELRHEASTLPVERVWTEWEKWASKGVQPSAGLRFLLDAGWLPDALQALVGCPQHPLWHPEGDVWTHTLLVCDRMRDLGGDVVDMFAALLHDIGKPLVTTTSATGAITSKGHAEAGVGLARAFMDSIGAPHAVRNAVVTLVAEHMAEAETDRAVRRLVARLGAVPFSRWLRLVEADSSGRDPLPRGLPAHAVVAADIAGRLSLTASAVRPLVQGRDLLGLMKPGPAMGRHLRDAFEAQLDGEFNTTDGGVQWVRRRL